MIQKKSITVGLEKIRYQNFTKKTCNPRKSIALIMKLSSGMKQILMLLKINQYCLETYNAKKWAFVSDYARLKIIYENGGVYLNTDVELLKDITPLISNGIDFIGFQNPIEVNTGLGFAAEPHNEVVKAMLCIYEKRHFVLSDGTYKTIPCPVANTLGLINCGLKVNQPWYTRIQMLNGIKVYPEEYFKP